MSNEDDKGVLDLSDPRAQAMKDRIAAAKQSGHVPVGGVPMPTMPRLDQPPPGAPRDRGLGVQQSHQQQAAAQQGPHTAMSPDQYQQAVAQGQAIQGVGGGYVANQPKGFQAPAAGAPTPQMEVHGDEHSPANPVRPEGGLRPETAEALKAVAEANAPEKTSAEKIVDEDLDPNREPDYEDYDFGALGQVTRDLLSDRKRREAIEVRCDEMDFTDLILNQELRQEVPIKRGFVPTFRTPNGAEDLFCKRKIGDEEGSNRYVMDKYAAFGLVCGIYSLNGQPLPEHRKTDGTVDDAAFEKKMAYLLKYPIVIVADLSVNFTWFNFRVQKLLSLDKVKDF